MHDLRFLHSGVFGCDAVLLGQWHLETFGTTQVTTQHHILEDLKPQP